MECPSPDPREGAALLVEVFSEPVEDVFSEPVEASLLVEVFFEPVGAVRVSYPRLAEVAPPAEVVQFVEAALLVEVAQLAVVEVARIAVLSPGRRRWARVRLRVLRRSKAVVAAEVGRPPVAALRSGPTSRNRHRERW